VPFTRVFPKIAKCYKLGKVMSKYSKEADFKDLNAAIGMYKTDLTTKNENLLEAEWDSWKFYWNTTADPLPKTPVEALYHINTGPLVNFFPNMITLLTILAVLPVTTASVGRSNSTLKRVKTFTRSTKGRDRLTALALLTVHKSILSNTDSVVFRFAENARRIRLRIFFIVFVCCFSLLFSIFRCSSHGHCLYKKLICTFEGTFFSLHP